MFAFWIIGLLTGPIVRGPNGPAAVRRDRLRDAFFFNAVPELLYQGSSRSFGLLMDSARFMFRFPVVWRLPNIVFAALGFARNRPHRHPSPRRSVDPVWQYLLVAHGHRQPSSPPSPTWGLPIALFVLHYVMIFRGILFHELSSGGGGNARLRAWQAKMRQLQAHRC